jgi:hypothetical protein
MVKIHIFFDVKLKLLFVQIYPDAFSEPLDRYWPCYLHPGSEIILGTDVKTNLHKQYAAIDDREVIDLCILAANSIPTRQSGLGPYNLSL